MPERQIDDVGGRIRLFEFGDRPKPVKSVDPGQAPLHPIDDILLCAVPAEYKKDPLVFHQPTQQEDENIIGHFFIKRRRKQHALSVQKPLHGRHEVFIHVLARRKQPDIFRKQFRVVGVCLFCLRFILFDERQGGIRLSRNGRDLPALLQARGKCLFVLRPQRLIVHFRGKRLDHFLLLCLMIGIAVQEEIDLADDEHPERRIEWSRENRGVCKNARDNKQQAGYDDGADVQPHEQLPQLTERALHEPCVCRRFLRLLLFAFFALCPRFLALALPLLLASHRIVCLRLFGRQGNTFIPRSRQKFCDTAALIQLQHDRAQDLFQ